MLICNYIKLLGNGSVFQIAVEVQEGQRTSVFRVQEACQLFKIFFNVITHSIRPESKHQTPLFFETLKLKKLNQGKTLVWSNERFSIWLYFHQFAGTNCFLK